MELLEEPGDVQGIADAVKLFALQLGIRTALAVLATPFCYSSLAAAQPPASGLLLRTGSISGTIVDAEGVPQMGALVQLLSPDMALAATALTDAYGRYRLPSVAPGAYRVCVSAALFLPVVRRHLIVASNTRAVVNMTLSMMLSTTSWLPATRRAAGEGDDDWMWTLRASTMRPVLRLAQDEDGDDSGSTSVSSSAEQPRSLTITGRMTVQENEGGFARGGTHNVLSMTRRSGDTVTVLRADFSGPRSPFPVNPSADLTVGVERKLPFSGTSRSVLSYASHPEIQGSNGAIGLQSAILRNAQRMELGDSIRLDAGSVTRDVSLGGNAFTVDPFLQLSLHPASGVVIAYTFTRSRGMESLEDLDRVQPVTPTMFSRNGHVKLDRASHHALSLSTRMPKSGVLQIAVYRDQMGDASLAGIGLLPAVDAASADTATDPTTATFIAAAHPYKATGVRLTVHQPVTSSFALDGAVAEGQALQATTGGNASLAGLIAGLESRNTLTASLGASGRSQRTGTSFHAGYRWQPNGTLTAVDRFRVTDETAYLHAKLRQSLRACPMLPAGLEAVLEVQNLLEQGYQPFLSHDGRILYLAQSPRVLQAGLSFTF